MKSIKFVATAKMPIWKGYGGEWHNGHIKSMPTAIADRMLDMHNSPFVEVKDVKPEKDKMMHGAKETKEVDINELKKIKGDNLKKKPSYLNLKKKK